MIQQLYVITEQQLYELFSLLESFSIYTAISEECSAAVLPFLCQYVTGFWKTDQNVTLGQLHFLGPANSHTHILDDVLIPVKVALYLTHEAKAMLCT